MTRFIGIQRQRLYPQFGERPHHGRAIRLRHHDVERAPLGVAGVKQTVAVGVEHLTQRFHVTSGGRIPVREHHLVAVRDRSVAIGVEHQHAVTHPGPGGAVVIAISAEVEVVRTFIKLGNGETVAVQVE